MVDLEFFECTLKLTESTRGTSSLRSSDVFGKDVFEKIRAFNQGDSGESKHEYPRIQFKTLDNEAILVAIASGSEFLRELLTVDMLHEICEQNIQIDDFSVQVRRELVGTCESDVNYRFETPWLALNQKNFRSYTGSRSTRFRKDELSRILVGNCLGLNKTLGLPLRHRIASQCDGLTSIKNSQTGDAMIGFVGRFTINYRIPDNLGLGKEVGRGMGTVRAVLA